MRISNVWNLGIKELRGLSRDTVMLVLIVYAFTLAIYAQATELPETLHNATIGIVDEDRSPLSARIEGAFYSPYFKRPSQISRSQMDQRMDSGADTFALDIPPNFEHDLLAGRSPELQLNVDATRMTQAFSGSGYIQNIVSNEIDDFLRRYKSAAPPMVHLNTHVLFNPNLKRSWFGAVTAVIDNITMLSIILTGAALIREREHGTVEHLLVMPVSPIEIMLSKTWSMALVVLGASFFALALVVRGVLAVPTHGSTTLFLLGALLDLFATTSLGVALATTARSMPQFSLLLILIMLPLQVLSGGVTPRESMPEAIQAIMLAAPNTHFVALAQAVLFRGAGFAVVWPQLAMLLGIGLLLFGFALWRFRKILK